MKKGKMTAAAKGIKFSDWERIYEQILEDFGFERRKDEESARIAYEILSRKARRRRIEDLEDELRGIIEGKEIVICGNAPCLDEELRKNEDFLRERVVISADGATSVLLRHAILPEIIVTDLDGVIADIIFANRLGSFVVVHAHGDNIQMVKAVLPELNERVICTTQSEPFGDVRNYGGFTDGDRCAFLAVAFGAAKIHFLGFDFERCESERKRKKLRWAKRLIEEVLKLSV